MKISELEQRIISLEKMIKPLLTNMNNKQQIPNE